MKVMRRDVSRWLPWPRAVIVVILAVLVSALATGAYLLLTGADAGAHPPWELS